MGLSTEAEDVARRVRQFCKLFVGGRGAITRMHQDNFRAHAWLSQVRGRKLYVLASPADSEAIWREFAPAGSRHGREAAGAHPELRFDPLDPRTRARCLHVGIRLYSVVLQPGETIVAPDGWWHYAVSLTPTITLMCNFWDKRNLGGLHECMGEK